MIRRYRDRNKDFVMRLLPQNSSIWFKCDDFVVILGKVVAYKNINVSDKQDLMVVGQSTSVAEGCSSFQSSQAGRTINRHPMISLPSAVSWLSLRAGASPPAITPVSDSASASDKATYFIKCASPPTYTSSCLNSLSFVTGLPPSQFTNK
jgi:hypothetical protein